MRSSLRSSVRPDPVLMRIGARADKSKQSLERQLGKVAQLPEVVPVSSKCKRRSPDQSDHRRQTTPRRVACWKAVRLAKSKGASLRAIARETVAKYARSVQSPLNRVRREGRRPGRAGAGWCDQ